jgi:hypothetical protein
LAENTVENVSCTVHAFFPKVKGQTASVQHAPGGLHYGAILPLRHSILLGSVRRARFVADALVGKIKFKLSTGEIATSVRTENGDTFPSSDFCFMGQMTRKPEKSSLKKTK